MAAVFHGLLLPVDLLDRFWPSLWGLCALDALDVWDVCWGRPVTIHLACSMHCLSSVRVVVPCLIVHIFSFGPVHYKLGGSCPFKVFLPLFSVSLSLFCSLLAGLVILSLCGVWLQQNLFHLECSTCTTEVMDGIIGIFAGWENIFLPVPLSRAKRFPAHLLFHLLQL